MKKIMNKISIALSLLIIFTMISSATVVTAQSQSSLYQTTQISQNTQQNNQRFGQNMGQSVNRIQTERRLLQEQESCDSTQEQTQEHLQEQLQEHLQEQLQEHLQEHLQERLQTPDVLDGIDIADQEPSINLEIQNETWDEETEEDDISTYDYVDIMGDVTQEDYNEFATYLEMSDDNLIADFAEEGWNIILTSADLDALLFDGKTEGVMGCTYYANETIYVEAGDYSYCVIHELGHYLDYYYNNISTSTDFISIFEKEAVKLSEYGQTSSAEFFAEVYIYSILNPDTTLQTCPNAYVYINNLVDAVK